MRYVGRPMCLYISSGVTAIYNAMAIIVLRKNSCTDKFAFVIFGLLLSVYDKIINLIKINRISTNNNFSQSKPIMQGFSMRTSRKKDLQWLFNTHDNLCFNVCHYCNGWTKFEIINILMTFHDVNKYRSVALLASSTHRCTFLSLIC